jgi:hypothetical protein
MCLQGAFMVGFSKLQFHRCDFQHRSRPQPAHSVDLQPVGNSGGEML